MTTPEKVAKRTEKSAEKLPKVENAAKSIKRDQILEKEGKSENVGVELTKNSPAVLDTVYLVKENAETSMVEVLKNEQKLEQCCATPMVGSEVMEQ